MRRGWGTPHDLYAPASGKYEVKAYAQWEISEKRSAIGERSGGQSRGDLDNSGLEGEVTVERGGASIT
jgi:hypothetical protein